MEEDIKVLECENVGDLAAVGLIDLLNKENDYDLNKLKKQALKNLIRGYRKLKLENQALQNTKDTCPNMATSGIRCDAKEKLKELEIENQSYRDYMGEPPCYDNASYIKKSKIKEKIEELKLPNIIVGGRRNYKVLEYGKKIGKLEILQELLEEE